MNPKQTYKILTISKALHIEKDRNWRKTDLLRLRINRLTSEKIYKFEGMEDM